jgi:hypothetical protein
MHILRPRLGAVVPSMPLGNGTTNSDKDSEVSQPVFCQTLSLYWNESAASDCHFACGLEWASGISY